MYISAKRFCAILKRIPEDIDEGEKNVTVKKLRNKFGFVRYVNKQFGNHKTQINCE